MAAYQAQPVGLAQIIFETLLDATSDLLAEGEYWTASNLRRVKRQVREQFAASRQGRDRDFFELVFDRAFDEAAGLLEQAQNGGWLWQVAGSDCQATAPVYQ